jgi:23S rRNA pseudouridine2605 synthase
MSKLRLASRSEAQRLVRAGAVTVNGRVVTDPLAPVVPERDAIAVAGKPSRRRPGGRSPSTSRAGR